MQLKDQVAIVTGATQGIGRGIARRFAREGAAVVVVGRNEEKGTAVVEEARRAGGEALYVKTDIRIDEQAQHLVARTLEVYGQVDVLVNNAGVRLEVGTPFFKVPIEKWQQTLDVNLTGMFLCSRAIALHMIERGAGRIINITSVHGRATTTGSAPYAASKGAIIQLTKAMAIDLAPYGIAVNAIAPGGIHTESRPSNPEHPFYQDHVLLRRPGTVDEIAACALFLSTPEASYINGETITVDGGLMALLPGKPIGTP